MSRQRLAECTVIDAHVHVHRVDAVAELLDAACSNFSSHRPTAAPVLMLAQMRGQRCFEDLAQTGSAGAWRIRRSAQEDVSLAAARADGASITLIAGRQVVTAERIEVLALACLDDIPDGMTLEQTLTTARQHGALVVLPWGFGKWLAKRGRLVMQAFEQAPPRSIFLGDNAGRPRLWPEPALFRLARSKGVPLLSGTDPLPLPGEHLRVGTAGTLIHARLRHEQPAAALIDALRSPNIRVEPVGQGLSAGAFLRNQMAVRMHSAEALQA